MRVLVKADAKTCQKCKYHIGFGSQPGKAQKKAGHYKNVACNYLAIEGHSRIFENAEMTYDPKLCDKFEKGVEQTGAWTSDNMTEWRQEEERQRLWKELENANGSKYRV